MRNGPHGQRYELVRPDHTRVVGLGPHRGYVERPLASRPGYVSRTYVVGGHSYARVYRTSRYRSVVYYNYVPAFYFQPLYYGWVVQPWPAPIAFDWGWGADPWYGFYGPYFAFAPFYPNASLWLTDYLLAANLRAAYENQAAADPSDQSLASPAAQNTPATLTPAVRQAIADEVRQQVEAERTAAAQPFASLPDLPRPADDRPPPALDPKFRTFVVSQDLELDVGGQTCMLTPGDIVVRASNNLVEQTKVPVTVLSSKPGDCPASSSGLLEVADLQEMYNDFREKVRDGLKTLADNQGKGGVPAGPAANPREVMPELSGPDLFAESELAKQQQAALQAATEVQQDAAGT